MNGAARIAEEVARRGGVVRVTVIRAEGSTPRETGAAMLVASGGETVDTIGGGVLEDEAIAHARRLLSDAAPAPEPWHREWRDFALGPSLGQCCGGAVRLLFERFTQREWPLLADAGRAADPQRLVLLRPVTPGKPPRIAQQGQHRGDWPAAVARVLRAWADRAEDADAPPATLVPGRKAEADWFMEPLAAPAFPLVLYGAGHVGRTLVRALEGLPFRITWVDGRPDGFPPGIASEIVLRRQPADPAALMKTLPAGAIHLVMTHSHPLDLAICHTVLRHGDFRFLGLIGSQTKRARFLKRLAEMGIGEPALARLTCPIGLEGIDGKQPAVIAVAVAAQMLRLVSSGQVGE